jgi:hypothetical protein
MKVNRKRLFSLYMAEVNRISATCDWVSTFGPEEIVEIISTVLENHPYLCVGDETPSNKSHVKMKTPFGNTPAAIQLASKVENDKRLRRLVSKYCSEFLELLHQLSTIQNPKAKKKAGKIIRDWYFSLIRDEYFMPVDVKDFLCNVLSAYYRGFMQWG